MNIIIYGKNNCEKCEKAKEKLSLMNFIYQYISMEKVLENKDAGTIADILMDVGDFSKVPLIKIDNKIYTYPKAMSLLKKEWRREKK